MRLKSSPFVAVIGGSGSGKSSLVRAGLHTPLAVEAFPRLSDAVRITVLPGSNPLRSLADQVAHAVPKVDGQSPETLADAFEIRFRERPDGLLSLLTSRFPNDSVFVLLVVDQFEGGSSHTAVICPTPPVSVDGRLSSSSPNSTPWREAARTDSVSRSRSGPTSSISALRSAHSWQ